MNTSPITSFSKRERMRYAFFRAYLNRLLVIVFLLCSNLFATALHAQTTVTLDANPKTTEGVTFSLSGSATVQYGSYWFETTAIKTATISISRKIDISTVYFNWGVNVQGATVEFYNGANLVKSIPWGDSRTTATVNAANIDKIILRENGTSRSGGGELRSITYTLSASAVTQPGVTTTAVTGISSSGATLGGNVTSDGGAAITEHGIVYSTSNANPTVADAKVAIGTGTGAYATAVSGLSSNTTYYVRAYAVNSAGTSYGTVQTFTTLTAPTLPLYTLNFNGTNQYVAVPNRTALEFTTGTVEMWIKPDWTAGTKGANPCVISMRSIAGTRYSIHLENNLQGIGIWNGVNYLVRPYAFTKGQWYHVAAVMTTSSTEFFVNGVSIGTTANGINASKTGYELKIGASETGANNEYFLGAMDEVRVWNTARTASQILANYGNPVSASSPGLLAYYALEEGVTGPANAIAKKVTEYTANGYHGTLYNYYSSNADLSNLTLSTGTLSPSFASGTTGYSATVPYVVAAVNLTPTTTDATATVKVNGTAAASGSAKSVNLNVGANTITVAVTAQDGAPKTYTVTITRAAASANADLASISLSSGSLSPAFAPSTTGYAVTVAHAIASVNITPAVADATATMTVDGIATASGNAVSVSLAAGTMKSVPILVTAQSGATKTYTVNIIRPYPPVSASISSQINVSCNGGTNGSATVAPAGGTSPYTYSWSPAGGTGATASGLTAGTYTVTVTDANGQTATANATITQPAALATTSAQANVSCFSGSNGAAAVYVTGGTAPYTYAWAPTGGTAATATGLAAGSYTVTVTDANGCTTTRNFTITQPAAISATVSATHVTSAGGNNGSATVTATGGVAPYTYNWSPRGGTGATANTLSAGNYTVTVRDAYGCTATKTVTILEPTITNVLSISRPGASSTNAATVNFSITFDQPVTGLSANNFELSTTGVSGATIAGVTPVNSTTYTVAVNTGTGSGEISLSLANDAGLSLDVVNVPFTGAEKYTIDKDNPVVTGVADNSFYNTSVTISFNEGTAKLNGNAFTSGTEVSAEGTYTLVVTDAATNATTVNFTIDKTNPVVNGVADNGKYNTDRSISFNEGTATLNGVAFANGTVVSEEGEYTLVVTDAATNTTTVAFEIDKTNPTGRLAINNGAGFTNTLAVTLQITAADAGGTGVTEMRFFNNNSSPSAWEPLATTKAWTLSSEEGIKTVYAEVRDAAGNMVLLNAPIVYDATRPTVVVSSAVPAATNAAFNVTFTFSEGVNGLLVEDITVENGAASAFTKVSSEVYTATIIPATEGTVKVSIAADKAEDYALNGNTASNEVVTIYNVTKPSVELYTKAADHVNAPYTVAFTFSEPVTGFTLADIAVTNGTASFFENANGQVYTALITPIADGEVHVSVPADAAIDGATNGNTAAAVLTRLYDVTQPEVVVATAASTPTNAPFTVTFTFTEEVSGFDAGDITVTNGTAAEFISVSGKAYTAVITPAADGEVTVSVAQGLAQDMATNGNKASNELKLNFDATKPAVTVATTAANPSNSVFSVTFTFSEEVSGFEAADVTVVNGTLSDFSRQSTFLYAATVTPTADGEVKVSVVADVAVDAATNGNLASNEVIILYDVANPTVALTAPAAEPINAPFTVTFTFSEPVMGFAPGDISVANATVSDFTAAGTSVYTVLLTPAADGIVTVSVAADVAQDAAGNGNESSAILSRTYDAIKPTVALATMAADPTNAPFEVRFNFSEEVFGFEVTDITVTNGAASALINVDGQTYTALITPAVDGEVTVALAAGVASDKATNPSEASAELALTYDATAPAGYTVAFNTTRVDVTNAANISLSITGAEVGATYFYSIASNNGGTEVSGTAQVQQSGFELNALDLGSLNDGTLAATLYLVDEAGNEGASAMAEVIKITRDIVAVTVPEVIRVPIRTAFANVPMPAKVEVTYSTGAREQINVTWSQGNFNGLVAGAYELTGELVLNPMTTNIAGKVAKVTVEVESNIAPTGLAFSATTFKPEATADEVIGTLTTTDPDDTEFVYSLVSGAGDTNNALFEIQGDKVYLKSNNGLSGMTAFTIRVRSTDPYGNTIERTFTLTKQAYDRTVDQLKVVNAFSPNGDGINDNWTIPELRFYNEVYIQVFDRSGVRVFETRDPETGWDGRGPNGQILKGAFLYTVEVKDINWVKRGVVTILGK